MIIINLSFNLSIVKFHVTIKRNHVVHYLDFTHKTKILQCENIAIFNEVRKIYAATVWFQACVI